jgi:serine/threonine-protein kinase RsbT
MEVQETKTYFPISSLVDVVRARRRGLEIALEMGFPQAEATKIAVVISELGRNIERYAKNGSITITTNHEDRCILILAQDWGPGIPDVERVLAGGYSTSQGLGLGISGSKRLMDKFEIKSVVGVGTTIKAIKWLR